MGQLIQFFSRSPSPQGMPSLYIGDKVEFFSPQGYFERGIVGLASLRISNLATGKIVRFWGDDVLVDWDYIATTVSVPRSCLRLRYGFHESEQN